jgi:hypothetical protein
MTDASKATIIDGQVFKPIEIPATGQWQLRRLETIKSYVLVHPNGRQAWFNDEQINAVMRKHRSFKFTDNPLKDINTLAGLGLRPFHVDADFDPTGLADATKH